MMGHSGLFDFYKSFYSYDLMMRAAFEGNAEKFKEAAKRISHEEMQGSIPVFWRKEMAAAVSFQIFAAHSHKAGMEAFAEAFGDLSNDRYFGGKISSRICLMSNLAAACIAGDDSLAEQAVFECGMEFLNFVVYILMLCRKFNVLRKVFPILDKNSPFRQMNPNISLFDDPNFQSIFVSSAVFRDREAIEALFDLGFCPDDSYYNMLCPFADTVDFLSENYYKQLGFDRPPSFDELFCGEDDGVKLNMMYGIYTCNNTYVFEKYAGKISPVKTVPSNLLELCRQGLESENGKAFGRILSDNLTVILNSHNAAYVMEFAETFGGDVKIDLSQTAEIDCFSNYSVSQILSFLDICIISPEICRLCPFTEYLLKKNSSRVTAAMISKGIINLENLREMVDYMTEKKLLNALNAVNKSDCFGGWKK